MLHAGFGFAVKIFDLLNKSVDSGLGVWDIAGWHKDHIPGLRMVTVLFPLETSIPTAFMIKTPLK